jgi:hypothetical protein
MALHLCKDCGKTFKSSRDFEDAEKHRCIAAMRTLSVEELKALLAMDKP